MEAPQSYSIEHWQNMVCTGVCCVVVMVTSGRGNGGGGGGEEERRREENKVADAVDIYLGTIWFLALVEPENETTRSSLTDLNWILR